MEKTTLLQRATKAISELKEGKRIWFMNGSFHLDQGFTITALLKDDLQFYDKTELTKEITLDQAKNLAENKYCTNNETVKLLLSLI